MTKTATKIAREARAEAKRLHDLAAILDPPRKRAPRKRAERSKGEQAVEALKAPHDVG